MKLPRRFFQPLAVGAPEPYRELPVRLERMIHFVPPHIEKVRRQGPELAGQVDVVLGNLEDAIPADAKEAARRGFIAMAKATTISARRACGRASTPLNSPWVLDDIIEIVGEVGDKLDVVMLPKVEGPWDIHYLDQLLAQLEARHGVKKPILIHAILETAEGVKNVEAIATASPRMHGMSLGPADLAASRGMKTTRVGGGHPEYKVHRRSGRGRASAPPRSRTSGTTPSARMVDACRRTASRRSTGRSAISPTRWPARCSSATPSCMGCAGAWSLHPSQIAIAKRVFAPDPAEVAFARRILDAMPDGTGAVMIDGKMQDDATWKQAKVIVDLAQARRARKDPEQARDRTASVASATCSRRWRDRRMRSTAMIAMPDDKHPSAKIRDRRQVVQAPDLPVPRRDLRRRSRCSTTPRSGGWRSRRTVRPAKDQPFYHLFAENAETEYVAYVSEQNLLPDDIRRALCAIRNRATCSSRPRPAPIVAGRSSSPN